MSNIILLNMVKKHIYRDYYMTFLYHTPYQPKSPISAPGLIWVEVDMGYYRKMSHHNLFITYFLLLLFCLSIYWSVRVAERLALPTSDHGVAGSNPAGGEILPEPKRRFIAQSLSCSPSHRLEMTEILLKGRKTLTHPSISIYWI